MSRGTRALISQSALKHNYARVQQCAPNSKIWAVVKANAYGHDALLVAQALSHADGFAVSTLDEGRSLRDAGIEQPIILLEGVTEAEHWQHAAEFELECVVHNETQLKELESIALETSLRVWMKIDTGMHRLGFLPEQVASAKARLSAIKHVQLCGQMTHLACADTPELSTSTEQVEAFNFYRDSALLSSIGNSAAIMTGETFQGDWVRPGIMLYGAVAITNQSAADSDLKPVMNFETPVIAVRLVRKGEKIGYGHCWQAKRDSVIATLAAGYGDGYPRHAPNGTPVWINGSRAELVGRVSMDMIMIDITDISGVTVGDIAQLWGDKLPVDEVAKHIGTIGYELLTRISPRVTKELID
jgi:alanine racemase